jgi:heme-degrading monooxygenase HmoA
MRHREGALELDPGGGQVVVTRFECTALVGMLMIIALHLRVKRDVRRHAPGFIGIRLLIDWRRRTILSISLWQDLASVYAMGNVRRHVEASRLPAVLGATTTCGVFCFVGDWRRVMFGSVVDAQSPLRPLPDPAPTSGQSGKDNHHATAD